jgi:hypothetical protein
MRRVMVERPSPLFVLRIGEPEVAPPCLVQECDAIDLALVDERWLGLAVFIYASGPWTVFEEVSGGLRDEAFVRANRNNYAELVARVGPHLITVQMSIDRGKNFEGTKPSLIELSKLYVSRLRGK